MLVDVGHQRMLRGAWVATVYGINWPSSPSSSAPVKEAELRDLIATLADSGINAIFLQVRSESDALYASSLEPWSRFLTGTQGLDPGFDPLAVALDEAHARHVELHAWLNPYRGLTSTSVVAAANHPTRTLPAHALPYDGMLWMDPASAAVRAHLVEVVEDIIGRYPVDGIHFDDYFYPYPDGSAVFPDEPSYQSYVTGGGTLSKSDWRRGNVNALIQDVSEAIRAQQPAVRFGVSPFGIYRPGQPEGITGLDAYEAIGCDPVTWIDNDWTDYLAPQLYWPTTQTRQAFGTLLPWWADLPDGDGRFVLAGMNLNAVSNWGIGELEAQLDIVDANAGAGGVILYHADPLLTNEAGISDVLRARWARPSLPPPVAADERVPEPPAVLMDDTGSGAVVTLPVLDAGDKSFALYLEEGGAFILDRLVATGTTTLMLPPGRAALTVVGRNDRESRGVLLVAD